MNNTLARVRIKDFANTATIAAQDDYLALDGETNGTRRISSEAYLKPLTLRVDALEGVGGNLNAYDFGTGNPTQEQLTVYAIGQIWPSYTDLSYNADNPAASTFNDAQGNPHSAAEIFNATRVKNLNNDDIYMLTNTQDTTPAVFDWANVGQEASQNLKQLGEIYFSLSNLTKYNPGAILINAPQTLTKAAANYSNLVQFVQDNPAINKTPAEWQSYYTQYGQCPYFALTEDGEGDYNLQLPVVKEYIKAVNPADGTPAIKAALAGLPNHLHAFGYNTQDNSGTFVATSNLEDYNFGAEKVTRWWNGSNGGGSATAATDPYQANMVTTLAKTDNSNTDGVYGSSDTVTPAHITLYPWLYVFYSDNNPGNQPIPFELLPATAERLGGIKVGPGLNAEPDGTLTAIGSSKTVTDLGQVISATFETNKNYAVKIGNSATFTLPTVTDTTIENAIKLNLEVLREKSTIDWGVNANDVLKTFTLGKYEIRLRFNNNTSLWTAEVLKEQIVISDSPMKILLHFDGNSNNAVDSGLELTRDGASTTYIPTYAAGKFAQGLYIPGNTAGALKLPVDDMLNIVDTSFTLQFWGKMSGAQGYVYPIRQYTGSSPVSQTAIGHNGEFKAGGVSLGAVNFSEFPIDLDVWYHNAYVYDAVNKQFKYFQNGVLKKTTAANTINLPLSGLFFGVSSAGGGSSNYTIDEFRLDIGTALYTADFTPPSAPFEVSEKTLADITPIVPVATADSVGGIKLSYDDTTSTLNIVTE